MKKVCVIILALFLVINVSGCASMGKRGKCALIGAASGAVVGGGIGTAIGNQGDTDNRAEGSAIGAGAGALIGGLLGFLICKEEVPPPPPPAPAPEPEVTPPPKPRVVEKVVLNAVLFDFDKATIKPEFVPVLDEAVAIIKKYPGKKVTIEGNTDSVGTESYNIDLSLRRAGSVKTYLVNKGIPASQLETMGYGEEQPVADNSSREGRQKNRRVEFKVIDGE